MDEIKTIDDITLEYPSSLSVDGEKISISQDVSKRIAKQYHDDLLEKTEKFRLSLKAYNDTMKSNYDNKISKANKILRQSIILPDLDFVAKHKIAYGVRGDYIRFILPFHYAPTSYSGRLILNPKDLVRDIFLAIDISGGETPSIQKMVLLKKDLSKFEHYHYFDDIGDCWGDFKVPKLQHIHDLVIVRDNAESLLANLGRQGETLQTHPEGLPSLSSVIVSDEVVEWKTSQLVSQKQDVVDTNTSTNTVWTIEPVRQQRRNRDIDIDPLQFLMLVATILVVGIMGWEIISSSFGSTSNNTANTTVPITSNITEIK